MTSSQGLTDAPDTPAQIGPGMFGPVEVFRVGTFTDMNGSKQTITADHLQKIAQNYDPENHPAPVVIGHPETNAPAFGWVERLWVEDDILKASIRDASPEFVDMVKAGRYKRVSISLFLPTSAANPIPGELYMRHVGFLGAQAPAVPGLKPVKFAGDALSCFSIAQDFASPRSAEQIELEELRRAALDRKVEDLIGQGRVLPAFKDEVLNFAAHLGSSDSVSFSDGSQKPARDWFFDYLAKQPAVVSFGELDLPPGPDAGGGTSMRHGGVNIPDGYTVDPTQSDMAARAHRISREKSVSFAEAVDMILTGEA